MASIKIIGADDDSLCIKLHEGFMKNVQFTDVPPSVVYDLLSDLSVTIPKKNLDKAWINCKHLERDGKANKDVKLLAEELKKVLD
ncbi:hypothetical protein ISS04_03970 [Candidatus Woesearchaeota archaeon]|nr:hypothetical protein [Candidatus Woesearchaeota archaeon]